MAIACMAAKHPSCSRSAPTEEAIAGEWYHGDGIGFNLTLTLYSDHSYLAERFGCDLKVQGQSEGRWSLRGSTLSLSPSRETGLLKGGLRRLSALLCEGRLVLVAPEDRKGFEVVGPRQTNFCFVREDDPKGSITPSH